MYRSAVTPYQGITKQAIREDILPRLKMESQNEVDRRRPSRRLIEFGVFGLTLGVLLGGALAPFLALGVAILTLAVYLTVRLPMNRWMRTIQIVTLAVGVGVLAWPALAKPDTSNLVTVVVGWLGIEVAILLTAAQHSRR